MKNYKNQTGTTPSTPAPTPAPSSGGGMSSNESIEKGITPTK